MKIQCYFINEKNQKNNNRIIEQLFLLFSSSIFNIHFVINACFFLIFDNRFCIMMFWNIFEIVFERIVIEQKTYNCNYISKIDDVLNFVLLILNFDLYDNEHFLKIIVEYFSKNFMHFFSSIFAILEILIWIFNDVFTIIVNDFFRQFRTIKSFCQYVFLFVFERSIFLIFVFNDVNRLFIFCVKILSCYMT